LNINYRFFEQNKNNSFFPRDFFDSTLNNFSKNEKDGINNEKNNLKQKSIFVNLQKEYDEDRELLELLGGTGNGKHIFFHLLKLFKI
jgi:phage/plasmid-associated DNA primase